MDDLFANLIMPSDPEGQFIATQLTTAMSIANDIITQSLPELREKMNNVREKGEDLTEAVELGIVTQQDLESYLDKASQVASQLTQIENITIALLKDYARSLTLNYSAVVAHLELVCTKVRDIVDQTTSAIKSIFDSMGWTYE